MLISLDIRQCYVQVEWPGKGRSEGGSVPKGYVYVVLEGEGAVPALLSQVSNYYTTYMKSSAF